MGTCLHSLFFTLCTATAATNKICHFFLGVCVSNTPFRHTSSHPISAPNYILRVAVIAQVILHAPLLYAISNILGKIARFHSLVWKQVVLTSHVYVWFLSMYCISFSLKIIIGSNIEFRWYRESQASFLKIVLKIIASINVLLAAEDISFDQVLNSNYQIRHRKQLQGKVYQMFTFCTKNNLGTSKVDLNLNWIDIGLSTHFASGYAQNAKVCCYITTILLWYF